MAQRVFLVTAVLHIFTASVVNTAQQKVMLSESYLPVAMQVIANLVDQMAYESTDQPAPPSKPATKPPTLLTTKRPPTSTDPPTKPTNKPQGAFQPGQNGGWTVNYGSASVETSSPLADLMVESTTPFHKPGLYAPIHPPKPNERLTKPEFILLPLDNNAEEYTVLRPQDQLNKETLLSPETVDQIKPIVNAPGKETFLPPEKYEPIHPQVIKEFAITRSADEETSLELGEDELNDNHLQYLSSDLRDMLKLAHDNSDERAFDINNDGFKAAKPPNKVQKLSQSNLRMLLLYDLLSREAKRLKLSDFGGFSDSVMSELAESANGGARSQLSFALSRMLERKDSQHEYANNRAKEMVAELKRDESILSSEIRYLKPLLYRL